MTVAIEKPVELPKALPAQFKDVPLEIVARGRAASAAAAAPGDAPDPQLEDEVYTIVLSTENPIDVGWAIETLSHESSAVDMAYARTGLTLFLEHGGPLWDQTGYRDPELRAGVVENIRIEGRRLVGDARFSDTDTGRRTKSEMDRGILKYTSIGWVPVRSKPTKVAKSFDEKSEVLWTRWTPIEVSIVSVPADPKSVTGRSAGNAEFPVTWEGSDPGTEERTMEPITTPNGNGTVTVETPPPAPAPGAGTELGRALEIDRARSAEIHAICTANRIDEGRMKRWINGGTPVERVKSEIFDSLASDPTRQPASEIVVPMSQKQARQYSYARALEMGARRREGNSIDEYRDEWGIHQDIEKQLGRSSSGVLVPMRLGLEPRERGRAMVTNQPGKGGELVFDEPQEIIEILRATSVTARMGARFKPGTVGNPNWPRRSGDITVTVQGENPASGVTPSDLKYDYIIATPRNFIGRGEYSRQEVVQTGGSFESELRESLGVGHALAIDRQCFHGTGAAGQIQGIYNVPDVLTKSMSNAEPTWLKITDMIGAIADSNALRQKMGFVTTALMGSRLMGKLQDSVAGAGYIWQTQNADEGTIGGYRAIASTQLSKTLGAGGDEHGFIFGNWNDLIVAMWGALEIIVDPYTKADKGMLAMTSYQLADCVVRHGPSFCCATAAKLT
jgi:HK97 family phage major capsid protein